MLHFGPAYWRGRRMRQLRRLQQGASVRLRRSGLRIWMHVTVAAIARLNHRDFGCLRKL